MILFIKILKKSNNLLYHTIYQKTPYSNLHHHNYTNTIKFHNSFYTFHKYILQFIHKLIYQNLLYNLKIYLLHTPHILHPYYTTILHPIPSNYITPNFTQ